MKIRLINLRLFSFFSWERKRQKVYLRRSGQFLVTSHLISLVVHPEESWILDQLLWWPLIIIHEYEITIVFGRTESSIIFFQKDMRYPWKLGKEIRRIEFALKYLIIHKFVYRRPNFSYHSGTGHTANGTRNRN